jgi:Zn-dependent protease with chaperone function
MYWLRCAIVALVVFAAAYISLSAALAVFWQLFGDRLRARSADALFLLRISPLVVAYTFVTLLTIPSFLAYEPVTMREGIRTGAMIGAAIAIALLGIGVIRSFRAWRQTARLIAACTDSAKPAIFVAGFWRGRLMISESARQLLNEEQLAAAVRHESAHVDSRDNLKQLLLRFCSFPFPFDIFRALDRTWLQSAEMAADDAAAVDQQSALDLASALTTVARTSMAVPKLGMSLVPSSEFETNAPLAARIERLLAWKPGTRRGNSALALAFFATMCFVIANATALLSYAHEVTELLFTR